ncbi:hypothetical protein EHI8A_063540 [Entamoeba histolytica HM-1:IMSS-B]|uniref:PARP catalytic domain-containing protein n=6 Tax=Entamoeba histolytica TaxID=5759 RepID=B1N495_ENTH1|nr:hypothetical protein EHI_185400 [Entamoeba histolytica HM-1:IMSS]XP_648793.1 hypothetical protein EHI_184550 [Entamoeba histolytica HM-1:IMSS]EMD44660.1 Hypothetical protein EHI5A_093310 [Entamoeba histolytica KU27]EMH74791.1 hypothetical protein EHI8A_063540 [Entamoeba histolytica HM-1:IMSS-B]EMS12937.1 hypothetical protein KM1_115650 [Entamoeba histolytica HM-3:IMSS]ENY66004.1 hypothetical protein EHI7A_110620 [Entamoeba histolytica HM-1:IMSS-A]GAT97205.1 hypothetical protein CL6EHI_1845|eukprot:XP_001914008.1 hypothetical protein EHI_185400 [Entamoeba histolytica HM-1:IMSS]
MEEIVQKVENEICEYCTEDNRIFLIDHDTMKHKLTLGLTKYDEEFEVYYDKDYPKSKYYVQMKGKNNEHTVKRTNSMIEIGEVKGIKEVMKIFLENDKDERNYIKKKQENREIQKKKMKERMKEVYKRVVSSEEKTKLNFNTQLAFQILSDDIIEIHLNKEKYKFDVEAVGDNPFHWIVSFFGFNDNTNIGKDIMKLETLSTLDCIQMEFKFSVTMFPVFPPEYNFLVPKLTKESVRCIFQSGVFADECYNPFTKIKLFNIIWELIKLFGRIDFGVNQRSVLDYTNKEFYNEQQLCKPFIGQVTHLGQEFILNNKINNIPTNNSIQFNSFITQHCPCIERFLDGMKRVHFISVNESGFFCWHGTSDASIKSICREGFDPMRRTGQSYGRGEYFGKTANISMTYCKGNYHLILCYVLKSDKVKKIDLGYVVDNPSDWSYSYCLPLLVITYGNGKPVNFLDKMLN